MASRPRNLCSISNRTGTRPEKCRKGSSFHTGPSKGDCMQDLLFTENRYGEPRNSYPQDCLSDTDFNRSDERSSNGSIGSICDTSISPDGTGDMDYRDFIGDLNHREKLVHDTTYSSYPNNKRIPTYTNENYEDLAHLANPQRKNPDYIDKKDVNRVAYERINDPHGLIAVQKLQKLKELQRRRDYTEKFYAQEIRRLIGNQGLDQKTSPVNSRQNDKVFPQNFAGDRIPMPSMDNLEPCGTMTTITRLNCGCVEQMSRPIFTTTTGRVQKRSCTQTDQQQVHMRLSAPNTRLVLGPHHSPPPPPPGRQQQQAASKLKSKSFTDPRSANNACHGNVAGQESPGRANSPVQRKISDSTNFSA